MSSLNVSAGILLQMRFAAGDVVHVAMDTTVITLQSYAQTFSPPAAGNHVLASTAKMPCAYTTLLTASSRGLA